MIQKVFEFHKKFELPDGSIDYISDSDDIKQFRIEFLKEELNEFKNAKSKVDAFDALLDLVYVAQGTALFMGISPEQWCKGMNAVHASNMMKERVTLPEQSKRESKFDVIKPEGWVGPEAELEKILNREPQQLELFK